ncbi:MAG: def [Clostridiales bacterium]|jgi:peptide deformylase|nr:def [Clostridiales bacterium]
MALREVRKVGDELLRKKSRKIQEVDEKIRILLEDMVETMGHEDGVGLAAPQVGILKRAVVIDGGEMGIIKLINPEIIAMEGSQSGEEGCLSVPGRSGIVERPQRVTVKALDDKGEEIILTGEDLIARAFCHEIDHLDGILFIDKIEKE